MRELLDGLMPRLFPGVAYLCVSHQGKSDLVQSLPRKLRAWNEPDARFCVIHDNDGGDCRLLKAKLLGWCPDDRRETLMVRIACQELEAWYFGEPAALARAFDRPDLERIGGKASYREPDAIVRPSAALLRLLTEFQKVSGARSMGREMGRDNTSRSFRAFITGVEKLAADLG